MLNEIKQEIIKAIYSAGVTGTVELVSPPKSDMGDFALACFNYAKQLNLSPVEAAKILADDVQKDISRLDIVEKVAVQGPYVNFYLHSKLLAERILNGITPEYGIQAKNNKKVLIEFAQPNTHKAFHIGHLRGTITGESLSRIMAVAGYDVVRVNYQGDVGMHIAKCLWSILQIRNPKSEIRKLNNINEKIDFLSAAYVAGAKAFEENEDAKKEIVDINGKIYDGEATVKLLYDETRAWSLEYFNNIYERLDTRFDRFYFESEMFRPAIEIVKESLKKEILKQSNGAVIFEGSKHGLHDRVFLNSLGLPTYEGKDLALAQKQFEEFDLDEILHVVGKEQTEYFKVLFKVLEQVLPQSRGKEKHLSYGWVSLKEGKMSSRTGAVVLAEDLMADVNEKVSGIMKKSEINNKEETADKVAMAALKYSFLKTGVHNDIVFNLEESVSLTGDSGPYLLYIVARINSILKKAGRDSFFTKLFNKKGGLPEQVGDIERKLLMKLAEFDDIIMNASEARDPSKIAQYLFTLAQLFNNFYHELPILKAEGTDKAFRIQVIKAVHIVMSKGLNLLGINTVEEM
ncbi:MAG: arginine--tRNA ligase [bacterium]|nr:arginine--tRNA ligase [bacterium]